MFRPFLSPTGKWQVSINGRIRTALARRRREIYYLSEDRKLMAVAVALVLRLKFPSFSFRRECRRRDG